ncbi:MAG: hypothetical protein ACE5JH_00830 [Acidobacteriota bacterium]
MSDGVAAASAGRESREAARPPDRFPVALAAFVAVLLASIYTYRLGSNFLKWEEPRRCLVAMEMIHRGDYIVPRVMGELYFNKPPLQNWLIALFSGLDLRRVGPVSARLVTLAALAGLALILWRLGLPSGGGRPDPLPALVFLSTGLIFQFGRVGEIDVLFCLLVTAALGCFEWGRRRGSDIVQWVLPQVLLGVGVLTKAIAPIFFYPPVLFCAWCHRRRIRLSVPGLIVGFLLMLGVVALWVVPYAMRVPAAELRQGWAAELARRFDGIGTVRILRHVATYPLRLFGVALPWSLALLAVRRPTYLATFRAVRQDPYAGLCASAMGWAALIFFFLPGINGRYLMPLLPCVSVMIADLLRRATLGRSAVAGADGSDADRLVRWGRHWIQWAVLTLLVPAFCIGAGWRWLGPLRHLAWLAAAAGVLTLAMFAHAVFVRRLRWPAAPLLLIGLIYGIGYAGVFELIEAEEGILYRNAARTFHAAMSERRPVVLHESVDRKLGFALTRLTGRPVWRRPHEPGPYYYVASLDEPAAEGATVLASAWRLRLSAIGPQRPGSP